MKKIKRTIYYYELEFNFKQAFQPFDGEKEIGLFESILKNTNNKEPNRYQIFGERIVAIQNVKVDRPEKIIDGVLRCVRKDILPEIMNTETDVAKGIEAAENEGLVETSHFLIDYSKNNPILCLEYNQFGSKIGDFIMYLNNIGNHLNILHELKYAPIVKDELKEFKKRMGQCSEFHVKVHKDNLDKIKDMDNSLTSVLDAAVDHYSSEYAQIKLKFDYRTNVAKKEINETIKNIINYLLGDKKRTEYFNTLKIKAQDSAKNNYLETFDLLVDRIKSDINVQRKERYRTIVRADIIEKIKAELIKKFHNVQ